jgi:hypothetical protein
MVYPCSDFTEAEVPKILFPLLLVLVFVLSLLFSGCDDDNITTTTTPKITNVIDDIQPDEINLDNIKDTDLPGQTEPTLP